MSTVQAGWVLSIHALACTVLSPLAVALTERIGRHRGWSHSASARSPPLWRRRTCGSSRLACWRRSAVFATQSLTLAILFAASFLGAVDVPIIYVAPLLKQMKGLA